MFPSSPDLCTTFLGSRDTQEASEEKIVENIYAQKDLREFLAIAIEQLTEAERAKRMTWRCQHLLTKIRRHPLYKGNAPAGAIEAPPLLTRTSPEDRGTFPNEFKYLSAMKQRANELRARDFYDARQILETMKEDEKSDPRMPKDQEFNRSGRELGVTTHYSDVTTPYQSFRLGACPKTFEETSALFRVALEAHDSLFVSLHDEGEHKNDRNSDFWENASLDQTPIPGWTVKKTQEVEVDRRPTEEDVQKVARIVESTLTATKNEGEETRTLTHFRIIGWQDASPLPSEDLFYRLVKLIAQRCRPEDRPLINCIGGIGRTGTTAVALYCIRFIDAQLAAGIKLEDIRLNVPEIIYQLFRTQRHGLVGQTSHLAHLYAFLGQYYDELKTKRDMQTSTENVTVHGV